MKRNLTLLILTLTALCVGSTARAEGHSPKLLLGTWVLDESKSIHEPVGSVPIHKYTQTFTVHGDGYTFTRHYVDENGVPKHNEYTVLTLDGKPLSQPATGATAYDSVACTQLDEYTFFVVHRLHGIPVLLVRMKVAKDGKTINNDIFSIPIDGPPSHHNTTFDKQ